MTNSTTNTPPGSRLTAAFWKIKTRSSCQRFRMGVLLAVFGGLRLGEHQGLRSRDVHLLHGTIRVVEQAQRLSGGTIAPRASTAADSVSAVLRREYWRATRNRRSSMDLVQYGTTRRFLDPRPAWALRGSRRLYG